MLILIPVCRTSSPHLTEHILKVLLKTDSDKNASHVPSTDIVLPIFLSCTVTHARRYTFIFGLLYSLPSVRQSQVCFSVEISC